jgi:hypothetical protein
MTDAVCFGVSVAAALGGVFAAGYHVGHLFGRHEAIGKLDDALGRVGPGGSTTLRFSRFSLRGLVDRR